MDKANVRLTFSAMPLLGERRWRQQHQLTITFPFDSAPKLILERNGITSLYGAGVEHCEERRRGIVFFPNAIDHFEVDKREISVLVSDEQVLVVVRDVTQLIPTEWLERLPMEIEGVHEDSTNAFRVTFMY